MPLLIVNMNELHLKIHLRSVFFIENIVMINFYGANIHIKDFKFPKKICLLLCETDSLFKHLLDIDLHMTYPKSFYQNINKVFKC